MPFCPETGLAFFGEGTVERQNVIARFARRHNAEGYQYFFVCKINFKMFKNYFCFIYFKKKYKGLYYKESLQVETFHLERCYGLDSQSFYLKNVDYSNEIEYIVQHLKKNI